MIATLVVHSLIFTGVLTLAGLTMEMAMRGRGYPRRWGWVMTLLAGSSLIIAYLVVGYPATLSDPPEVREGEYSAAFGPVKLTVWEAPRRDASPTRPLPLLSRIPFLAIKGWDTGLRTLETGAGAAVSVLERSPLGSGGLAYLWGFLSLSTLSLLSLSALRLTRQTRNLPLESLEGTEFAVAESLGPAVVGILRPRIILPRWIVTGPAELHSMVLLHEEEHLRARDTLLLAGALGAIVLTPWNPFVWIQFRRLRLAMEIDCDARVVRRGIPHTRYAATLLDVGGRSGSLSLGAAALAEPPHFLERRMKSLCTPMRKISGLRAALVGTGALVLLLMACNAPRPADPSADADQSGSVGGDLIAAHEICMESAAGDMACAEVTEANSRVVCRAGASGAWGCEAHTGEGAEDRLCPASPEGRGECAEVYVAGYAKIVYIERPTTEAFVSPVPADRPGDQARDGICFVSPAGTRICADSMVLYEAMEQTASPEAPPATLPSAPAGATGSLDLSAEPTFTPYNVLPSVRNHPEVEEALVRAYPAELRNARIAGRVTLHMFIDETGVVGNCIIASGSGHSELDQAALRVCPVYRFAPAQHNGTPVPVWVQIPVSFSSR